MLKTTGKTTRPFRLLGPLVAALLGCLLILDGAPTASAAPAWLPAADLSAPGKDATNTAVAMDDAGDTVAVWERQDTLSSNLNVQVATRSPGAGFSAPADLSHVSTEPDVAMTPAGETVAVWRHFDVNSGNYVIQTSTRPPGGSFSNPVNVSTSVAAAIPQNLQVAVNAAGDTALVWTQFDPGSGLSPNPSFVGASVRPAGGSFSPPVQISPTPLVAGQSASHPRAALDAAGDTTVVWSYQGGTNSVIQAATRPVNGSFSPPTPLTAVGADAFSPDVAMDSAGDAIAVWAHSDGTNFIAQGSSSQAGGPFAAPVDLSGAGANASSPQVAMTPSGAATVVWARPDSGGYSVIQASTGSPGGSFSSPVTLSATGHNADFSELAVSPSGGATVVWKRSDGTNDIVQAAIRPAGAGFAPAVDLSASGQGAEVPEVAMDGEGDATVVWRRSNGTDNIAQYAGYDADVPELRSLSIPSSGMVGTPVSFSVTPFDVWPIASTSFGFGDGTGAEGASVSHTYMTKGTYQVTVTSEDAAGTPVSAGGTISILPSNQFAIGRLSLNRRKGTGSFAVTVPGPGRLVLAGKGVKKVTKRVKRAGKVKLPIRARGKALERLLREGKVRVPLAISFTPDGGTTLFKHKTVTLIKKQSG